MSAAPVQILLVEDNQSDVELTVEALRETTVPYELNIAFDGVEAMAYLRKEGLYTLAPRPHLLLLDLNLPRKDGKEVLAEIRSNADLKPIPVAVLTTSRADSDITDSYQLGANCFITKPVRLSEFFEIIAAIESFWLKVATLPKQ